MSDLKRYEPTARRLQKLRQSGATPYSGAVAGAAVLAATLLLVTLGGRGLCRALGDLLAQDLRQGLAPNLQQAGAVQGAPAALLWHHLYVGGGIVIVLAAFLAAVAFAASAAQGALVLRQPWRGFRERQRRSFDAPALVLSLLALGGSVVLLPPLREHYLQATRWTDLLAAGPLWAACWRQLGLLAGLALLHLLWTRARYLQKAMLSHSELQEERKEAEGSWLKARRRLTALTQRQRRQHSD